MPDDLARDSTLGPYRIEQLLGRGGMATVYLAQHSSLQRRAALKVMAPELAEDTGFRDRFLRESRLAASLDHPNVVPVYEAGEQDGVLYMAMRYVEGSDLATLLRGEGPFSPEQALPILDQVASALDAAHERGLVHRDVKPSNVLLAAGDPPHAYLADFGLVKRATSSTALTATGQFVGTIDYTAPEQVMARPLDGRADQYSLACAAYQVLTGVVPFPRDYDMATIWAHVQEPPPRLSSRRPDLPVAMDGVLARAMAKAPEDRYETCAGFVRALTEATEGEPVRARPADGEQAGRHDVVLAHARVDSPAAARIAERLRGAGLSPWVPDSPASGDLDRALSTASVALVFVGPQGAGDWDREDLRALADRSEGNGLRVVPVLLPGLPEPFDPGSLPPFLATHAWVDLRRGIDDPLGFQALVNAVKGVPLARPEAPTVLRPDQSPYRGLEPFEEEDAALFFGREGDTQRLVEQLKASRFLAVLGPSGSGKSSLVKAGLMPALSAGALEGSQDWVIRVLKPGPLPVLSLVSELLRLNPGDETESLRERLSADPTSLHVASALALAGRESAARLVWVVDQFEEAFTLCSDQAEREAFIGNLLHAATVPGGRAVVVLTMRADFYPRLAAHPELAQATSAHQFLVSPMDQEGLRRAVQEPAKLADLAFEEGLVSTILADVGSEPGSLPLLEHALYELWERRRGAFLTLEAYTDTGGVQGALAKRAEAIYSGFDEAQQQVCRRIMLRLTQPGEGTEDTRRRARASELPTAPEEEASVEGVLDALVGARLLTLTAEPESGERWVDVAHEALIRAWPRLKEWIEEDRSGLILHRRLTEAASEWERTGKDDSALFRGVRLAEAEAWTASHAGELNPLEREFIEESRAASGREAERLRRTNRHLRGLLVGVAVFLVLAVVAGSLALVQRSHARQQAQVAIQQRDLARTQAAASASLSALNQDPEVSLLLAVEATKTGHTPLVDEALRKSVLASQIIRVLRGHTAEVNDLGFTSDGSELVSESDDGTIRIWDVATGKTLQTIPAPANDRLLWLDVDPAGAYFAVVGTTPTAVLYDFSTGKKVRTIKLPSPAFSVEFSPNGKQIATSHIDGIARVWDVATGKLVSEMPRVHGGVFYAAFSPDGRELAVGGADRTARVFDLGSGKQTAVMRGHTDIVFRSVFSPDGSLLLTASPDNTARVWDAKTGQQLRVFPHTTLLQDAAWAAGGAAVVTVDSQGVGRVWSVLTSEPVTELLGHSDWITYVDVSPDGRTIATASVDKTVRLWRLGPGFPVLTVDQGQPAMGAAWSPDGTRFVTGGGPVDFVWDAQTGNRLMSLGTSGGEGAPAYSRDGRLIATIGSVGEQPTQGGLRIYDTTSGDLVRELVLGTRPVPPAAPGPSQVLDSPLAVAFSPDSSRIAVALEDGTRIYDVSSGKELASFSGEPVYTDSPGPRVRGVSFSPDGRLVALADGTAAALWNPTTDSVVRRFDAGTDTVGDVRYSPDGTRLLTSAGDDAQLWDVRTGRLLVTLKGHQGPVLTAAFSPNGQFVVTAARDGTVRVWTVGGTQIEQYHPATLFVSDAEFSPDGSKIVVTTAEGVNFAPPGVPLPKQQNGTAQVFTCEVCTSYRGLIRLARQRVTRELRAAERERYLSSGSTATTSPAPSATAPQSGALALAGTYRVHIAKGEVSDPHSVGTWYVRLLASGEYAFWNGVLVAHGNYEVSGDRISFGDDTCGFGARGVYKWRLSGGSLSLTPLNDTCPPRSAVLSTHPLVAQTP